jgi:2-iminobutanoate/2-iminopropanoate deaminase
VPQADLVGTAKYPIFDQLELIVLEILSVQCLEACNENDRGALNRSRLSFVYSGAFAASRNQRRVIVSREIIRVEPLSSYLERYKAPASVMTRHGNMLYVSGLPPFDPATGDIVKAPIERQTELVLEQLKLCMETAGSSLDNILMCTVYCTSVQMFPAVNGVYAKFFPKDPPARMFVNVIAHPGPFDIEIDCVASV